jgi:para-aminobenzoate synthetase component 1
MATVTPIPTQPLVSAADALLRWPADEPLAALVSGGDDRAHNGWSIFARPRETVVIRADASREEVIRTLDSALRRTPRGLTSQTPAQGTPPFDGGWIVALGYGLGAIFEPATATDGAPGTAPLAILHWCEDAWCFEHATGFLHAVGAPPPLSEGGSPAAWSIDALEAAESDAQYAASVARAVEYIRAGDAFQANIARCFRTTLRGSARAFAHAAITENRAWFGASIDLPDGGCLTSMSPELFLRAQPDGTIVTRPIKGTRPAHVPAAELEQSSKDAAELAMIVDLMRNDLGRIAEIGSVSVVEGRVLETHRTVHHGVAEIRARIAPHTSWLDLISSTFPPGSVTGAPKVRAMQIIHELESAPRDFYCGALGFFARSGHAALNVAIRTAQVGPMNTEGGRRVEYHAGCGIVVESDPATEVAETHAKTRALEQLAG